MFVNRPYDYRATVRTHKGARTVERLFRADARSEALEIAVGDLREAVGEGQHKAHPNNERALTNESVANPRLITRYGPSGICLTHENCSWFSSCVHNLHEQSYR